MNEIKVSIIIPVYNVAEYLAECLESVLAQDLNEIEIICVDDGSTDKTCDVLREYAQRDARIRLYKQNNKGAASARNCGLSYAKGEFVYFLDGDDYIEPVAMSRLYQKAQKDKLDVLFFDGCTFFSSSDMQEKHGGYAMLYKRTTRYEGVISGKQLFCMMVEAGEYFVQPCLFFCRREFLEKESLSFKDGLLYEDNLFAIRVFLTALRVAHISDVLFHRRIRPNSCMTQERVTFRQHYSLFVCYVNILKYAYQNIDEERLRKAIEKVLDSLYKNAKNKYDVISHFNLTEKEMVLLSNLDSWERMMMKHLGFDFPMTAIVPFEKIPRGAKIILYGAGDIGIYYNSQIRETRYCNIEAWVDRAFERIRIEKGLEVESPQIIFDRKYDYILIAVKEERNSDIIKNFLVSNGVEADKIIWEKPHYISAWQIDV